ncbi:MAG TPA: hypothetical protein PLB62_00365 [Candidatus Sumerlaeota bacterium]|nr:hypothetical protein [Candidatus Sumerlaeota bacterium]
MKPIHQTPRIERMLLLLIMMAGGVGLYFGWRLFWFLTDDAYIAFRYVSNSLLGHGYVWNAPPFLPVEGYTSFLWVVLLDVVWRVSGVEPPVSVNWISLLFSYGALLLGAVMIMRIRWHNRLMNGRLMFVILFLVFLLLNRTFLAWTSSGLETALFNFLLLLWVYGMLYVSPPCRRLYLASAAASCLALTRPDGLLFCAATAFAALLEAFGKSGNNRPLRVLLSGLLFQSIVLAHLAWRISFYHDLLPNTYYAKVTGIWPESGFLYLLSFTLEYALWFAFILIFLALYRIRAEKKHPGFEESPPEQSTPKTANITVMSAAPLLVIGTLLFHMGYYTCVVGGDHFEFRVYSHLLPLTFIALAWSLNRLRLNSVPAMATALVFVLLSLPVPWTHWALTKDLNTRDEAHMMRVPVAPAWPAAFRWYARIFDDAQSWLIYHHVCMRHQEHKVFWKTQVDTYIPRKDGLRITADECPVLASGCVGVASWVLPHVYIIDWLGLNNYIIARTPPPENLEWRMAHSRRPPPGYLESFQPNVEARDGQVIIRKRKQPMTTDVINAIERHWIVWLHKPKMTKRNSTPEERDK